TAPPRAAMRIPVTEGPTMRPACQGMEPRAMALGRRSRSTSCGTSAMRLGSSKARKTLLSAAGARGGASRRQPNEVRRSAGPEPGEEERGAEHEGHQGLRRHEEPEPVDTIGEHAAAELEEDEGHALGEAEIGQGEGIAADFPGHPREGRVLGAVAEHVEDEAE